MARTKQHRTYLITCLRCGLVVDLPLGNWCNGFLTYRGLVLATTFECGDFFSVLWLVHTGDTLSPGDKMSA